MIKVNLKSGKTLSFNLDTEEGRTTWLAFQNESVNQAEIAGIAIHANKTLHVLVQPVGFVRAAYYADPLWDKSGKIVCGERVYIHADSVQCRLTIYFSKPSSPCVTRTDIRRIGKARYLTNGRPLPVAHNE